MFFSCYYQSLTLGLIQADTQTSEKAACSAAYLQGDISPGQAATSAEADFHVVKPTVSLGDVSDLHVAPTLGHWFTWQEKLNEAKVR